MGDVQINIHFDATTTSNSYNDGQEEIHNAIAYSWASFTGGYINSDSCDPPWYVGKGRGFDGAGGTPVERHFTTIAYIDSRSATETLLDRIGLDEFCKLWLENDQHYLTRIFEEKGVTNFHLEMED